MELFFFFLISLLLVYSIYFGIWTLAYKTKENVTGMRPSLPPGSFGWPIIGETLQFIAAHYEGTVDKFVSKRATKYSSKVFKTSLLGENFIVFSGAAANRFIFSNDNKWFARWRPPSVQKLFPSMKFVPIEHDAAKAKKFMSLFFKFNEAQKLVASIDSISRNQLKNNWEGKDKVQVHPLVNMYTFALVCHLFLSINDTEKVSKLLYHFNHLNEGILSIQLSIPGTPFYRAIKAAEALRKEIYLIIKERREALAKNLASPTQDVLSQMIAVPFDDGFMPELEIADKILAFLIGGQDTTTATITFAMKYLAEMPHLYNEVLKEQREVRALMKPREVLCWEDVQKMRYTWNFVNEVMRHRTIIPGAFREAKTDINYEGYVIPKGWKIYWSVGFTQHNSEYFSEPEKFNPIRFEGSGPPPYSYVPFGAGPLMCPGKEYARMTILVFLHYAVKMFKWEPILPNEKLKFKLVHVPAEGFPVRLSPHQN
ncbi:beta-amyrin 28-monooxygenase-like [Quercus lobata]|uniref:Cytochrome P450 n=1 Tax=Quercus lobata TaxID=97700 RepID=A0A7N2RD10_QUELO|nr:beta-amyrin 28-monooxygenase-like [Quercus lobata]XP_030942782.1 beta-amyrin 28-monooxygenase-like [Quercus lobata]XP_030942783.1 beta-amyrin 28-monooxygenase-like [Quercus lobata]